MLVQSIVQLMATVVFSQLLVKICRIIVDAAASAVKVTGRQM